MPALHLLDLADSWINSTKSLTKGALCHITTHYDEQ